MPVNTIDEVLERALVRKPEAIEWREEAVEPMPATQPKGEIGEVVTH